MVILWRHWPPTIRYWGITILEVKVKTLNFWNTILRWQPTKRFYQSIERPNLCSGFGALIPIFLRQTSIIVVVLLISLYTIDRLFSPIVILIFIGWPKLTVTMTLYDAHNLPYDWNLPSRQGVTFTGKTFITIVLINM